jgi:hypothetical protein
MTVRRYPLNEQRSRSYFRSEGTDMVNIDRHTDPSERSGQVSVTCAACRQSFVGRRVTAQFCSARCRKVAERNRSGSSKPTVTINRPPLALAMGTRSSKSAKQSPVRPSSSQQPAASSAASVTLNQPVGIVPDGRWPNMWRVKFGDGRLSEMVNLARARDALLGRIDSATRGQRANLKINCTQPSGRSGDMPREQISPSPGASSGVNHQPKEER